MFFSLYRKLHPQGLSLQRRRLHQHLQQPLKYHPDLHKSYMYPRTDVVWLRSQLSLSLSLSKKKHRASPRKLWKRLDLCTWIASPVTFNALLHIIMLTIHLLLTTVGFACRHAFGRVFDEWRCCRGRRMFERHERAQLPLQTCWKVRRYILIVILNVSVIQLGHVPILISFRQFLTGLSILPYHARRMTASCWASSCMIFILSLTFSHRKLWTKGTAVLYLTLSMPSRGFFSILFNTHAHIHRFVEVLKTIEDTDIDIPKASTYLGAVLGQAILDELLPLSFFTSALDDLIASGKALKIATEALRIIVDKTVRHHFHFLSQRHPLTENAHIFFHPPPFFLSFRTMRRWWWCTSSRAWTLPNFWKTKTRLQSTLPAICKSR